MTEMVERVDLGWRLVDDLEDALHDALCLMYPEPPPGSDDVLVDLAREIHSTAARIMALVGGRNEDTGAAIEVLDTLADAIQGRPDYEDDGQAREQLRYFVRELRAAADEVERRARCTPSS